MQFFVFLDVALVVGLLSMMFCLRPFEFTFVSEWMRQCKYEEHWSFLPYLVVVLLILVASLQLNWMHLVSLCYCDVMCETNPDVCRAHRQVHHRPVSRTDMLAHVIVRRTAQRYGRGEFVRSHAEHAALIEAFLARDAQWAQSTMTGHIRRAFHAFAAVSGSED